MSEAIECPYCGASNYVPKEDWPEDCSTTLQVECSRCAQEFGVGVACTLELR